MNQSIFLKNKEYIDYTMKNFLKKRSEIDLVNGTTKELVKKMILYTLPIIFVGILQLLYTAFDLIVVQSHDGSLAAAAVGANNSLISLITSGFLGLANGVNVVVARTYGKEDHEGCSRATHTGLLVSLIGGIFIGVIGAIFSIYFLRWMKVDSSYIDLANTYLVIYFVGLPFLSIYNFGTAILRGIGNSIMPLVFLTISGILNIGLNYLFVYAFNLSVAGVAWTTVISEAVSAFLVIFYLYRNKGFVNFRFHLLKIDRDMLRRILRIGIPNGIQGVIFSISNVILQTSVNEWGAEVVAANSDASSIEGFTYISMFAVSSTSSAFASANFGRGFKENVRKVHLTTTIMVMILGIVVGFASLLLRDQLLSIYMGNKTDSTVIGYASERLFVILTTYWLCGLMDNECGLLRGLGYSVSPLFITLTTCCIFRIFWDYCVYSSDPSSSMHSLGVLYACYPISWGAAYLLEFILVFALRKKYEKEIDDNLAKYNKRMADAQD